MIKRSVFLITICCFRMVVLLSQQPPIGTLRPLDDNHGLATDSADWKVHRVIKEIPLAKENIGTLLSFGGEIREQFRLYNNVNFGDVDSGVSDQDAYLQQRYMLHANLRINRFIRIFTQFNSCWASGKNVISPQVDVDKLGVMQAFVDLDMRIPFPVRLRLGRQEFLYGQERILAIRDGPTVRQTFDGARLTFGLKKATGDLFLVIPVSYQQGVLDNTRREDEYVLSSYWSMPLPGQKLMELYYFRAGFRNSCYANDTADENRNSLGIRLNKTGGSLAFDAEFTYQFGKFGNSDTRAWHLSSQVSYRWQSLSWKPRLMIREGIYSGDRDQNDGMVNTFRIITAKSPVHDLIQIGPANLVILSPEAEASLTRKMSLILRCIWVWRMSENDGLYSNDVRRMIREKDQPGEDQGNLVTRSILADLLFTPNKHFSLLVSGGVFIPGNYALNTGEGRNIEAFTMKATYRF